MDQVEYLLVDKATDGLSTSFALTLLGNKSDFFLKEAWDNGTILLYQRARLIPATD